MGLSVIPTGVRRFTTAVGLFVIACSEKAGGTSSTEGGVSPELCAAEVAAGASHTCVRATDGRIWCWGSNEYGQLTGDDYAKAVSNPRELTGLPAPAVRVAAGCLNTCAEIQDGSVWCWGSNKSGQLGTGTSAAFTAVPVRIEGIVGPLRSLAMNCVTEMGLDWRAEVLRR
jgi:alpha-tubulin suppressor-like RCC1 family protein